METKTKKKKKAVKVHHTMRIKSALLERIKIQAEQQGRSVNNMIEWTLDLNIHEK